MSKIQENKLRRAAERQGLRLAKSRRRDERAVDYGGYMLIDAATNTAIVGGSPYSYSADLDQIEEWLLRPPKVD